MYKLFLKRLLDIILSMSGLLVIAPIFIAITLLVKLKSGDGVFFLHERPGKRNKIFKVIKFKTMTDERDENGKLLPNELRVTSLGTFLRNNSLDELPQLINVLKGDMSLVGPRPLPVRYLNLYNDEQIRRHMVRPGITGWAQVNGRNNVSWSRKFELDVWYVDNVSFWFDIKILFNTITKVLSRKGIDDSSERVGSVGFNGKN